MVENSNRALVKAPGTALAPIDSRMSVPKPVVAGIRDVMLAFPAGAVTTAEDKKRLAQIYAEATDGFSEAVAGFAVTWLRLHNPRNPFPPTPQDLRELCREAHATWGARVTLHFFGNGYDDFVWGENTGSKHALTWGPPPLTPGCLIPDELVIEILREDVGHKHRRHDLVEMPAARFEAFPAEAFGAGIRDEILAKRKERYAREEEARKQREYLDSLGPDLRAARLDVLRGHYRRSEPGTPPPSDGELIAQAKALIEQRAQERAKSDVE